MIRSQISNKNQSGAILMIAMIMIAIMTSIGTSTLAKVMAETKSVRAGRKLLANNRPDNFNTLATIVSNKQRVFGEITNAPYLKPMVLDFVSIGNTRLTLNGLPVIYQMPNITRITCPSNQTVSVPITGSACPEYYKSWVDNYEEVFSQSWEADATVGSADVGNSAKQAVTGDDGSPQRLFTTSGDFSQSSSERLIMLTILSFDSTTNTYRYTYNKDTIFVPANTNLQDYNAWEFGRLREHLYTDDRVYKKVEIKVFSDNVYDENNTYCVDKAYATGDRIGTGCPNQCYAGVDMPACVDSYDINCMESANTVYSNLYSSIRSATAFGTPPESIADFTFLRGTELESACTKWPQGIVDCSVNNINYNDPYVLPKVDKYTFTNLPSTNIFTVANNTNNMILPLPANQRDTCSDFPEHEDLRAKLFMGALYELGASDSDKIAIGVPNINSQIDGIENEQPQLYWVNFIESTHNLLINNAEVQDLKNNSILSSLISDLDAPWVVLPPVFDKIVAGWVTSAPSQLILLQFFDSNLGLIAERKTSDTDCDDGSCTFDWDCGGSGIESFDYWYTNLPTTSSSTPYYLSGIGNVTCKSGRVIRDIRPDASNIGLSGDHYLTENKKATWTASRGIDLANIGPRLKGIHGTVGCILDLVFFIPYDGQATENCVANRGSISYQHGDHSSGSASSADGLGSRRFIYNVNYCVDQQGNDYGGGTAVQHPSQYGGQSGNIVCPNGGYIVEFKWKYKMSPWTNSNYSEISTMKDVVCSDGTVLQQSSGKAHFGNINECGRGGTCPSYGTSSSYRIWCDGEALPPYNSTDRCLERGFGTTTVQEIYEGLSTNVNC